MLDFVIKGGTIVDGTGTAGFVGDIGVRDGRIVAVGTVTEEAAETIMAAKDKDRLHLVWEVTDLWFHSMVLLTHHGLSVDDVLAEFRRREGVSGIDEKKSRTAQKAGA